MFIKKEDTEGILKKTYLQDTAEGLKEYIRDNIPLTNFMDFSVEELDEFFIKLTAPIEPNGNHYNTAFGGSIATLGILSGWALLHSKMIAYNVPGTLVIQQSTTKYISPARTKFEASCDDLTSEKWNDFSSKLINGEKAKLTLHSVLKSADQLIAKQESLYVGLPKAR